MRRDVLAVVLAAMASASCATSDSPILEADAAPQDVPAVMDVTAMDTPTTTVNCGAVTQCGTCTSLGPCGWCGASNSCVAGAAAGPSVGACAGGWSFSPTTCPAVDASVPDVPTTPDVPATPDVTTTPDVPVTPDVTTPTDAGAPTDAADPCASSTTCGTCTAQASCGFCQTTGRCQTGNRDAPTTGPACPSGWAWVSTSCTTTVPDGGTSMDTCGSATTCGTCTQRSQCGWCPGLNRCLLGTGTGPNTMAATCGSWAWYSGQCGGDAGAATDAGTATDAGATTDAGDPCVSATTCSTCTTRSQCGWCPGANRCLVGTSTGPSGTVAACGTWAWVSSACTVADAGTPDAGVSNTVPGFGNPTTFNASEVARACPAGGTLRLQVARVYATPRAPSGSPWDGIPGVTDFVCSAASDRIRTALRDQINGARMGTGDLIDRLVGDRFREVVSSQCGTAADWFLGRWEGPDMFANLYSPATATTNRWRTTTEDDSWEAPRAGATWANAYVDVPCSALGASQFRLEVRDADVIGSDLVGNLTFRANEVSPRAICTGYAFHEGVEGIAGALFRASVTGATQNCTGLR